MKTLQKKRKLDISQENIRSFFVASAQIPEEITLFWYLVTTVIACNYTEGRERPPASTAGSTEGNWGSTEAASHCAKAQQKTNHPLAPTYHQLSSTWDGGSTNTQPHLEQGVTHQQHFPWCPTGQTAKHFAGRNTSSAQCRANLRIH